MEWPEDLLILVLTEDLPEDRAVMPPFKDLNKDQGVMQIFVIHQEIPTQGNRIKVLQGIQVLVTPQEIQVLVGLPKIDLAFNDHPADPEVQIQEVRGDQAVVKEEEIDQYTEQLMINC